MIDESSYYTSNILATKADASSLRLVGEANSHVSKVVWQVGTMVLAPNKFRLESIVDSRTSNVPDAYGNVEYHCALETYDYFEVVWTYGAIE